MLFLGVLTAKTYPSYGLESQKLAIKDASNYTKSLTALTGWPKNGSFLYTLTSSNIN